MMNRWNLQSKPFFLLMQGETGKDWTSKLIWEITNLFFHRLLTILAGTDEKQGGIKLIYNDPPFAVGADFSYQILLNGGDDDNKSKCD